MSSRPPSREHGGELLRVADVDADRQRLPQRVDRRAVETELAADVGERERGHADGDVHGGAALRTAEWIHPLGR